MPDRCVWYLTVSQSHEKQQRRMRKWRSAELWLEHRKQLTYRRVSNRVNTCSRILRLLCTQWLLILTSRCPKLRCLGLRRPLSTSRIRLRQSACSNHNLSPVGSPIFHMSGLRLRRRAVPAGKISILARRVCDVSACACASSLRRISMGWTGAQVWKLLA